MPIWNWIKVHETQNLAYLYKLKNYDRLPHPGKHLLAVWKDLYAQYIKEFGIHPKYQDYLRKRREIAMLKCDLIITGDRINETFIEVAEQELKEMTEDKEDTKFIDVITILESFLGFQLETRAISVVRYYSYLRHFERMHKPQVKKQAPDG